MINSEILLDAAQSYLEQLDLTYIVDFMCSDRYPLPQWTTEDAQHCCKLYKRFLWLQKKYSQYSLVPTKEIDEFWHNHILYTQEYTKDCAFIFGHYLHHLPAKPNENPEKLVNGYLQTKQLYLDEFGEPLNLLR